MQQVQIPPHSVPWNNWFRCMIYTRIILVCRSGNVGNDVHSTYILLYYFVHTYIYIEQGTCTKYSLSTAV